MCIKVISRIFCVLVLLTATASGAVTSDDFARQLLVETNLARTDPQHYAGYLKELRRHFEGKIYRAPNSVEMVVTVEGVTAVDDAIRYLERQSPLPPLKWSPGLALAAADLVHEQAQTGDVGHSGHKSGNMERRIERHGSWQRRIAENVGYGPQTPRLMIMELIIDDNVPDRGHRKNIFSHAFTVAGAACGSHPVYRNMCVMDFAGGYQSN